MTKPTIYENAMRRADLFLWFGIDTKLFEVWLAALQLRAHPGLVDFWRRTGGGEVFESETLLGPLAPDESDNLLKMNEYHRTRGLQSRLFSALITREWAGHAHFAGEHVSYSHGWIEGAFESALRAAYQIYMSQIA